MTQATDEWVENIAPFATYDTGFPKVVRRGQTYSADDPLVRRYPERFRSLGRDQERQVEQATAAPGETRRVQIPEPEPQDVAVPDELICDIDDCGFAAKSDHGLRIHQAKAHQ